MGISQRDIQILGRSGINSTEALALSETNELPFSEQKAAHLIQIARQAVASSRLKEILIEHNSVRIDCTSIDPVLLKSVKSLIPCS